MADDPRRKMDEKQDRLRTSAVPLISSYTRSVLVEQPLGKPRETETLVIVINKSMWRDLRWFVLFAVITVCVVVFQIWF